MGAVELTVGDLDRTLDYWQRESACASSRASKDRRRSAAIRELVRFVEEPGAEPDHGHTGLYHVALLVPDRPSLARWLAHAARDQVELQGLSDHDVSEAIYLRDPDHHGIEIYADRPRELWEGQVFQRMTTMPLDIESLLGELDDPATEPFDGLPDGTVMGHVHLRVADVAGTVEFYRDVLGFGRDGATRARRPRSSARAAITTTSARTSGRAAVRRRRRPAWRRCATRRSCCRTRRAGSGGRARRRRGAGAAGSGTTACSSTTRRGTRCSSTRLIRMSLYLCPYMRSL